MLAEKECTNCREVKGASLFALRRDVPSGLASWCRRCTNDHINHKWAPAKRKDRKLQIIELKGGKCAACGGQFPHFVYDLHHRDPSTKEVNMTDLQDKRWERIVREVEKCDLLCANCHRIAHHGAGKP